MNIQNIVEGEGYKFTLKTSNPMHYTSPQTVLRRHRDGDVVSDFSLLLQNALQTVNDKQVHSDNLIIEAGTRPDNVDVAEVMNSIAEAELSLSMTKAVIDRALRAYQEITTMR